MPEDAGSNTEKLGNAEDDALFHSSNEGSLSLEMAELVVLRLLALLEVIAKETTKRDAVRSTIGQEL